MRWNNVIPSEMINVDTVATAAIVRFGNDAELDVTKEKNEKRNIYWLVKQSVKQSHQ